jgi:lysylphosphatidylglycerol synthetase-like protein (DUF2156 family)
VRVASWTFVLCTALGAVAVFLPSIELRGAGEVTKHAQLSLHAASTDRELVRKLIAAYHGNSKRHLGATFLHKVTPRASGRPRAALEDARDAMDTLDDVSDDDVRTAGTIFTIALWTLLGLDAVMAGLVFGELMRGVFRRGRLVVALAASVVVAAIAIALHLACREAVWQANDEVGRTALVLAAGAYVLPIAAVAALIAAIVLVARRRRPARGASATA